MYELVMLTERTGYIECPAKMGVFLCDPGKAVLIDAGSDKDAGKKALKVLDANGWQLQAANVISWIAAVTVAYILNVLLAPVVHIGRGILWANLGKFSMQVYYIGAACTLMQIIHILGYNAYIKILFKFSHNPVSLIRLGILQFGS